MEDGRTFVIGRGNFVGYHWHPNANEIVEVLEGRVRLVIASPKALSNHSDHNIHEYYLHEGEQHKINAGDLHYIEAAGGRAVVKGVFEDIDGGEVQVVNIFPVNEFIGDGNINKFPA